MKKEYLISIVLLAVLVVFSMPASATTSPAIIEVPGDYGTIQEAINAAHPGDTIHVFSGVYYEHVVINKTVSLIGVEDSFSTFIDGSGTGVVVKINASCALVKGFTIRNGATGILIENCNYNTITENEITDVNCGVTLYDSCYGNIIIDNKLTQVSTGIWVWYSNSNLISENYIADVINNGIDIAHSDCNRVVNNTISDANVGILTRSCTGNSIIDNYIHGNRYGIMIGWGSGYEANDHIVSCNTITNNDNTGVLIRAGSNNNTICYNTISMNGVPEDGAGISIWNANGNSIYHNAFINNNKQADISGTCVNTWQEDYPSGGNYWSDHPNPVDTNNDGICDTPYDIDMLNHDIYPLCNPLPKPMPGPNIIYVPSQYPTIVDAIDAAKPGDTILVSTGVYLEHVVINKPVSLIAPSGPCIIDGDGTGVVIKINASNVLLEGFIIWNGTTGIAIEDCSCDVITNNQVTNNNDFGITIADSTGNTITKNFITQSSEGIWVWYSNSNLISDNYIADMGNNGIDIGHSDCNWVVNNIISDANTGLVTHSCIGNSIIDNYIHGNRYGIMIGFGAGYEANDHIISCNTITNNDDRGILIRSGSSNNTICCNAITGNDIGIWIRSANDNAICHNNFIANPTQVDTADSVNTWYEDYPSGGNYWSNHPYPVDVDNDGICDFPYDITMLQKDVFPLCSPLPKPLKTFFIASFMTPEGEPYPFDVIISGRGEVIRGQGDGTWRQEFKNVTYIVTEVPLNFTLMALGKTPKNRIPVRLTPEFHFSEGEARDFEFYALDWEEAEIRTTPYIAFQEVGADACLSWNWNPDNLTLNWNLTCNPDKYAGVSIGIDDNMSATPNYGVLQCYYPGSEVYVFPIHFPPGECVISLHHLVVATSSQSYKVVFEEIDPALGTITIGNALYNDAIIPLHNITLKDLNGTEYPRQYLIPQYAVPSGNYIFIPSYTDAMIASIVNGIPCKATPGKGLLFDIFPPKIADMAPYTFSIIAENPFAHSSYSNLTHDEENKRITVDVSTETNYDWWGYFVLPDNFTVAAARSYDGMVWYDLDELYDYTINPADGYKIVVVRITPETDRLMLKYSPGFFSTGPGTYPSIFGIHNGTITPNVTIEVAKLYTYPCLGTGGHTEYARIWNNSGLDVNASWDGYIGDWHNISFNESFMLVKGETYNYTIRTGSYPQIHHTDEWEAEGGVGIINCTSFVDANGRTYTDWIPAIKLWA